MSTANIIFLCLLACLGAFLAARLVVANAARLRLIDSPGHRASHDTPTPTGGGIGMALGASLAMVWLGVTSGEMVLAVAAALGVLIAALGWVDDRTGVHPALRLLVQAGVVLALFVLLFPLPALELPFDIRLTGVGLWLVAMLAALWWINLFNFMDGIDGLAASQALFMLCAALLLSGLRYPAAVNYPAWLAMLPSAAAVLGFLLLNWPPARVFMGDTGSLFLGLLLVFFGLATVMYGWMNYPAWMILGGLFIIDATVTLFRRLLRGKRPHHAHRSHAYQRLVRHCGTHQSVTLLYLTINLLWILPLAGVAIFKPTYAWLAVGVAYTPLLAAALWVKAGKEDHA